MTTTGSTGPGHDVYRGADAEQGRRAGSSAASRVRRVLGRAKRRVLADERLYAGSRLQCPLCERTYRRFRTQSGRVDALCPNPSCLTLERHRLIWLLLTRELGLGARPLSVLHIAPEPGMTRRLRIQADVAYTSVDMESPFAEIHADVCDLPFDAASFDLIICSHVLEHVPDDVTALAELRRILRPAGAAIVMYPIDARRAATDEDLAITDPVERKRRFGQFDHVRLYGRDHLTRLADAGFTVETRDYASELDRETARRYAVAQLIGRPDADADANTVFICR